jgi:hypothetical protein
MTSLVTPSPDPTFTSRTSGETQPKILPPPKTENISREDPSLHYGILPQKIQTPALYEDGITGYVSKLPLRYSRTKPDPATATYFIKLQGQKLECYKDINVCHLDNSPLMNQ